MSRLFTGLYRLWSTRQNVTSNQPSLTKTAEKVEQPSIVSTKLKQISADEIGAEREICRRVDDAQVIFKMLSPTPVMPTRRFSVNCKTSKAGLYSEKFYEIRKIISKEIQKSYQQL